MCLARTVAAVAALPMDALVQVEALLSNGEGTIPNAPQAGDLIKLTNNTENAPTCPLSTQTVAFSHYNHLSAQLPIEAEIRQIGHWRCERTGGTVLQKYQGYFGKH